MLLLLDNRDSFTFNIAHAFEALGVKVHIERSDRVDLEDIRRLAPRALVIGPGPGGPEDAGCSLEAIRVAELPILGICLGHQALAVAFGGRVSPSQDLVHGELRTVWHDGLGVFQGVPNPASFTRYNSLVVERRSLPACLEVSARDEQKRIAALRHRDRPIESLQFHPESFLCLDSGGRSLLANFARQAGLLRAGQSSMTHTATEIVHNTP